MSSVPPSARPWDDPSLRPKPQTAEPPPDPTLIQRLMELFGPQPQATPPPSPGMNNVALNLAEILKKQKQNAVGAGNMTGLINEPIPR